MNEKSCPSDKKIKVEGCVLFGYVRVDCGETCLVLTAHDEVSKEERFEHLLAARLLADVVLLQLSHVFLSSLLGESAASCYRNVSILVVATMR